jgi:hypothetical protein
MKSHNQHATRLRAECDRTAKDLRLLRREARGAKILWEKGTPESGQLLDR